MDIPDNINDDKFIPWLNSLMETNGLVRRPSSSKSDKLKKTYTIDQLKEFMKKHDIPYSSKTTLPMLQEAILAKYKTNNVLVIPKINLVDEKTEQKPIQLFITPLPEYTTLPLTQSDTVRITETNETINSNVTAPYKKGTIPKPLRAAVWAKYHGYSMVGFCVCCKKEIWYEDYECSHIMAERFGGQTHINNLMPACRSCNRSMGTMNLHEFQKYFDENSHSWIAKKSMVDASTQTEDLELVIKIHDLQIID